MVKRAVVKRAVGDSGGPGSNMKSNQLTQLTSEGDVYKEMGPKMCLKFGWLLVLSNLYYRSFKRGLAKRMCFWIRQAMHPSAEEWIHPSVPD